MIFAAGLGTRLKPLTDRIPKALVEVGGHPLLDITIRRLIAAGATEIVVNVHHFGEQIIQYLKEHHYEADIRVSDERAILLDTGGGLRQAARLFTQDERPILIHNVDILHNADLRSFYEAGRSEAVTLMVSSRQTARYLLCNDENKLMGWTNITTGEVKTPYKHLDVDGLRRYAFSGIHCFSPAALPLMSSYPDKFPIMDFYLNTCDRLDIRAYPVPNLSLLDVGKLDSLTAAEDFLQQP